MTYALAAVFPGKKRFLSLSFVQLKLHIITDNGYLMITRYPSDPRQLLRMQLFFVSFCLLLQGIPAFAAESVILKYRIFRESLSVKELSTFAQTGKLSSSLSSNLASSGQNPQEVRKYLTEPVKVNLLILDKILNSQVGNAALDQLSQVIHTPSGKADRQALRSALILSANKDEKITLIEIIQNYPTSEVEVDGDRLALAHRQLQILQGNLPDFLKF
ncbi:alpha/beta hydrolase [Scytonema sp. NUACC26]|uniref:alpha/beta hydrolase n=1 Tax=Scytonema sp. NUACC26 TaxID=3140176 RepID=UPI0034DBC199